MGDLGWSSEVAQLQRELKGVAALVLRCIAWIKFWSSVAAFAALVATVAGMIALSFAGFFVFGVLLIGAAIVETWMFVDDPAPGLRAVQTVGIALLIGGTGTLIAGYVIWVVVQMLRDGLAWARARRVARRKGAVR